MLTYWGVKCITCDEATVNEINHGESEIIDL